MTRRILILTAQPPYPPEQGGALRNYGLLRQAARTNDLTLLTFAPPDAPVAPELSALCRTVVQVPFPAPRTTSQRLATLIASKQADMALRLDSPAYTNALHDLLLSSSYDILQVGGIEMAAFALALEPSLRPPMLFDAYNAEWLLQLRAAQTDWQRVSRWPAALYSSIQVRRLRSYERRICLAARQVLAVSPADAAALHQLDPRITPMVLPNGVDMARNRPGLPQAGITHPALVFTGKLDYRPNSDAALWFAAKVWPLVRARNPQAQWYLVGKNPGPQLAALERLDGVHVTGYVPEIQPYLAAADCYIAPLRVGGGTRLKLLEALACGLPIVTTTLGAEGLEVRSGEQLLLADTAADFCNAVVRLLNDRDLAVHLGAGARELACRCYDWDVLGPLLEEAYAAL
jgi:glycosyltransferase involved in cell wall biosynthesis